MAGDFESSVAVEKRSNSEDKETSPESKCCGCVLFIWFVGEHSDFCVVYSSESNAPSLSLFYCSIYTEFSSDFIFCALSQKASNRKLLFVLFGC